MLHLKQTICQYKLNKVFLSSGYIFTAECHLLISSCVGLSEILGNAKNKLAIEGFAYLKYHVEA